MATEKYLDPSWVDRHLMLPRGRAAKMARSGELPAVILPDGTIRIPKAEFEAWLERCRAGQTNAS